MSTEERYCINSVKLIKDKIRMDFTDNGDSVKRDFKQKATPEFYTAITGLKKTALAMMGLTPETKKRFLKKLNVMVLLFIMPKMILLAVAYI